mmetsp:Transcript_5020/g.12632  ORF Transcript_5020/g.12632 Transcript_5020/m.12632 type:complete len:254 (+) Transcript_5020:1536-2297(+)
MPQSEAICTVSRKRPLSLSTNSHSFCFSVSSVFLSSRNLRSCFSFSKSKRWKRSTKSCSSFVAFSSYSFSQHRLMIARSFWYLSTFCFFASSNSCCSFFTCVSHSSLSPSAASFRRQISVCRSPSRFSVSVFKRPSSAASRSFLFATSALPRCSDSRSASKSSTRARHWRRTLSSFCSCASCSCRFSASCAASISCPSNSVRARSASRRRDSRASVSFLSSSAFSVGISMSSAAATLLSPALLSSTRTSQRGP